uniref:Bli21 n=1 Tax=Bacillus licheniformis TaxID=1402 RepID=X2C0I0_BACLI|nr:Bli21 [Bacillus licheniformis]
MISDRPFVNRHSVIAVILVVMERTDRPVDRNFMKVRTSQSDQLCVRIGKEPALQKRIVCKIDSRNNVARMESGLFRFGKNVILVSIQRHFTDDLNRNHFFRPKLCRIKDIKVKLELVFFVNHLHAELILHFIASFDRFPKIAAVIVGIFPGDCLRFVPDERMDAKDGLPVKFNKARLAFFIYKPERMNAEAFHHPVASRNRPVRHRPHDHVSRFFIVGDKVPKRIVRCRSLRHFVIRFRLKGMHQVRELDGILNEENGDVIADEIIVPFFCIKLCRESSDITDGITRAPGTGYSREPDKHRCFH